MEEAVEPLQTCMSNVFMTRELKDDIFQRQSGGNIFFKDRIAATLKDVFKERYFTDQANITFIGTFPPKNP